MKRACGFRILYLCSVILLLSACADSDNYAPVADISTIEPIPHSGEHRVKSGETLYEISWRYGLDYRTVAARNHVQPSYKVEAGQMIALKGQHPPVVKRLSPAVHEAEPHFTTRHWLWPVKGKVINSFSAVNKGINITGIEGDAILAAAPGKVVYAGNGLRGYGNLIIIKHNNLYLSAYAHNQQIYVKEGQWVRQGQKIAEMGKSGTNRVMLHFEIRRAGKPVNPRPLLNIMKEG